METPLLKHLQQVCIAHTGCRLITLTSGDCTLAHAQALVVQKFGMLKQSLQKVHFLMHQSNSFLLAR